MNHYHTIEKAITWIMGHYQQQPSLENIAEAIHLSPFHFQKCFKQWAGISPKKFLQFITLGEAKKMLIREASLLDTAIKTGLSGTGRLHDLFITQEGMTPGEFKQMAGNLIIHYGEYETPFGAVLIGSTPIGICHVSFLQTNAKSYPILLESFPKAKLIRKEDPAHEKVLLQFMTNKPPGKKVKLHLSGSPFQLKVWEALLKIPYGQILSYGEVARLVGNPKASRAVGTAIGSNPIAYLIPCHRVIRASGIIGDYRWGSARKTALLAWESMKRPCV